MPTSPAPGREGRRPSTRALASLGAATRADDGEQVDPLEWVRRAQEPAGRHRAEQHRPALLRLPSRLRGSRLEVSRSAVLGVLLIALVIVVVGGVRVARALQEAQPESVSVAERESALVPAPPTEGVTTESPPALVVHVAGQVARPGITRLRAGDRVADAIEAAGGATDEADLDAINLARQVVDGEQVYVPLPGEAPPAAASGAGPADGGGPPGGPLDLNTADATALVALPGVGPVLADRIIAWRTEHGRFTSVDELGEVSGIGEKLLGQLRDKVQVGP